MDTDLSEAQQQFRAQVRRRLAEPAIRKEITALRAIGEREPDVRPLYRELGRRGLLAVNLPREYGGEGLGIIEATILAEELVRAGVPDTLHVNTIQIVALFLLMAGTPEQKARYLPALARGEAFACVLYTEPGSGSDLASLRTTAVPDGDGYLIDGVKTFSLKTNIADIGLCAARTSQEQSPYQGITLFLVELEADGVERTSIPSIADEGFHQVRLRGVRVRADAVVGEVGRGWQLLDEALAIERTGIDYALKAERWYDAALSGVSRTSTVAAPAAAVRAGRCGATVVASRLLAWEVIQRLAGDKADAAAAAVAKYVSSEQARAIADWAARLHGLGYAARGLPEERAVVLDAAYREGPGLTVSAGTSEMMLQIIASSVLESGEPAANPAADPIERHLSAALRAALSAVTAPADPQGPPAEYGIDAPAWSALVELGAPAFEVPADRGGVDLGLGSGVQVAEELGRAGLAAPYIGVALALDAAISGAGSTPADLVAGLAAGKLAMAPVGFDGAPLCAIRDGLGRDRSGERWVLQSATVVAPPGADAFCLPADLGGEPAIALLAADRLAPESGRPVPGGVKLRTPAIPLDPTGIACRGDVVRRVIARARVRQAAYLSGLARGGYLEAVRYAGQRVQFGRPLRDFQSIAFRLADAYCRLEMVRTVVRRAAWRADTGRPTADAATEALALAAETALHVVGAAMQVCGARGLTGESSTQRYYRIARDEAVRFGLPDELWFDLGLRRLSGADS
jgi:alkylation response protein AidB-like acyl-CoA dehydrogenase